MLPKALLTSQSRMSGSRWSGSWRSSLYSFSVYSCHLFLISSASFRSIPFLAFIEPVFAWYVPSVSGICNFLEEISSLSHSIVFLLLLCTDHWWRLSFLSLLFFGTLHSNVYIFPFLLCCSLLFSQLFVRPPQTASLHFFFLGVVLVPVSCTVSWTSIHSSSGTLSIRSSP